MDPGPWEIRGGPSHGYLTTGTPLDQEATWSGGIDVKSYIQKKTRCGGTVYNEQKMLKKKASSLIGTRKVGWLFSYAAGALSLITWQELTRLQNGRIVSIFFTRDQSISLGTPGRFREIALNVKPVTDKVTDHQYDFLYDRYLSSSVIQNPKLLEIGLGCDMAYGPGASSQIWPELFPTGEIWFAELDRECIVNYWTKSSPWKYVTGDQSDAEIVKRWTIETGGNFDFIIDDGGHSNPQIWTAFTELFFNALNPGGVYFIEDLHVGRYHPWYANGLPGENNSVVLDVLTDWMDQMVVKSMIGVGFEQAVNHTYRHILPTNIARIDCVKDMCAITKAKDVLH